MKPILYPENENAFDTNGIGVLSDAISCRIKETLNGQYELTMKYPTTGIHYAEIVNRAIILAKPNPVSDPQPFRVYRRVPTSAGTVTVYARHIAYDLAGISVAPFTATGAASAMQGLKNNAVTDCPFEFWTDKDTGSTLTVATPKAIWTLLGGSSGSVLDVFGGEYEFDSFTVKLRSRRGADRGVSIRYGKNLTSLEQDENCANCCTGVYPYWTDAEGGQLVQLPEKIVNAPGTYSYVRVPPLDLSAEWQEPPTEDQLRTRAEKYVKDNNVGVPAVSWKVEFVQLEQTEEYKGKALLERVLLGDTVSVEFPAMGVSASARVSGTDFDALLERYESVTLGSVRANIASTIAQQQQEISKLPTQSKMQIAISQLTSAILGAMGGSVRLLDTNGDGMPDTLYIADNPDPALAVKVWRFNYEGWGASENGYNGPFTMGASFASGIIADFIRAGTLDASLIRTGVIKSADGTVQIDLVNNKVTVSQTGTGERIEIAAGSIRAYTTDSDGNEIRSLNILPNFGGANGQARIVNDGGEGGLAIGATKGPTTVGSAATPTRIDGSSIIGIDITDVDTFTASIGSNGSQTFACSATPVAVIVAIQRGGTGSAISGVWTADMSGITQSMYGNLGGSLDTWATTVTISGKDVTITRGGSTNLTHYITVLSHK